MKPHLIAWLIALIAVLMASFVYVSRQTTARTTDRPETPEDVVERALDLLELDLSALRPDTQDAIRAAAVLAEEGVITSAKAAYLLGRQYEREQNFRGAEGMFKKAIALEPDWSRPYASLGDLLGLHSLGRTDEAMEVLQKATRLDPEWGRPHGIMAVIYRSEGRLEASRSELELALKYMPGDITQLNNYANLLVDLKLYDEAEAYYRRAIESFPEQPKPYYNLACLYALVGRKEETLANLREAFQRDEQLRYLALEDKDFASLQGDPAFEALVRRGEVAGVQGGSAP